MIRLHDASVRVLAVAGLTQFAACASPPTPKPASGDVPAAPPSATAESMAPEDVLFAMRNKEAEARRCFQMVGGRLQATASFSWQVNAAGKVENVELTRSTTQVAEVDACLEEFVHNLHYARRQSPVHASWTFVHGLADTDVLKRASKAKRGSERGDGAILDDRSPGLLATDEIENVAEHGFRLYAFCLRDGLNRNASLSGRVLLSFTIDPQGQVRSVSDAGSDLPDLEVIDCVAEGFYAMRFPEPQGGLVRLRYGVLLNED